MLEKDVEDQSDRLCERWSITVSQRREEYLTYNKKEEV